MWLANARVEERLLQLTLGTADLVPNRAGSGRADANAGLAASNRNRPLVVVAIVVSLELIELVLARHLNS